MFMFISLFIELILPFTCMYFQTVCVTFVLIFIAMRSVSLVNVNNWFEKQW